MLRARLVFTVESCIRMLVLCVVLYFVSATLFATDSGYAVYSPQRILEAMMSRYEDNSTVLQTLSEQLEAATRRGPEVLQEARDSVGATMEAAMGQLFNELDRNGDGVIQREEFEGMTLSAWAGYRAIDLSIRSYLTVPSLSDTRDSLQELYNNIPGLTESTQASSDSFFHRYVFLLLFVQLMLGVCEHVSAWIGWPRRWRWPENVDVASVQTVDKDVCLTYDTPLEGWYEICKTALFTLSGMFLLRLAQAIFFFVLGMVCVNISVMLPFKLWYKLWLRICSFCVHMFLFSLGFFRVGYDGQVAPRDQVKLLVGNHCAVLEVIILFAMCTPSFVTKIENLEVPLFAGLVRASDAILVDRSSRRSRRHTMKEIQKRSRDPQAPQLMIFPEGTVNNQRGLFKYQSGAFGAQQAVQPVCFKFPYKHFNPCWSGRATKGNDVGDLLWRLTCQFVNHVEVKVLPVYQPTLQEEGTPELYAAHVQRLMAAHLCTPVSSATHEDYVEKQRLYTQQQQVGATRQPFGWTSLLRGKSGAHQGASLWLPFAPFARSVTATPAPPLSSDDDGGNTPPTVPRQGPDVGDFYFSEATPEPQVAASRTDGL
eukprot:TRINITY_DN7495_c0_g1_i1.p1 TRINITY_DN7495_c0_g1~~TRINITY_DN7495_c0_g1_i1.p1  ORF type:complete len:597 (+),score=94.16 TRINITY_DN7495_c0_g1_i1:178-1968(+)